MIMSRRKPQRNMSDCVCGSCHINQPARHSQPQTPCDDIRGIMGVS